MEIIDKIRLKLFSINRNILSFWGKRNLLYALYWGVVLGKKSIFRGHCYFKKSLNSTIVIGDNFTCVSIINESNLIKRPCTIQTNMPNAKIEIGDNVGISGGIIACFKNIKIGDNVKIGGNCSIFDGDFHLDDPRAGIPKPIIIGNNVWIGYSTIILKGVHIGENTVIGAGSVVTKDIPANCVAAGSPCRVIKQL